MIAGTIAVVVAYALCDELRALTQPPEAWWWLWRWSAVACGWVASAFGILLLPLLTIWLLAAFPLNILYKLLFMPFMERLSELTEQLELGCDQQAALDMSFSRAMVVGAVDAIGLSLLQGALMVLLLPLNLIAGLGLLIPPAISAGLDYSDMTLVRHQYRTRGKIALWSTFPWRFFGFGCSFFFLLGIPVLNALALPAAAAGSALLYLELDRK